jgi:hypothetical protein
MPPGFPGFSHASSNSQFGASKPRFEQKPIRDDEGDSVEDNDFGNTDENIVHAGAVN